MKRILMITPVAMAVAAVFASPVTASEYGEGGHHAPYELTNEADVRLDTDWDLNNDIAVRGYVAVAGVIPVGAESGALVDGKQMNKHNRVTNDRTTNDARVDGNALQDAEGNLQLNVTAGTNNQQANEAAISALDAEFVFASAQNYALQSSKGNHTANMGVTNNAALAGNALQNAAGNIGVNIAAGTGNQQRNELSASFNSAGTLAKASSWGVQENMHNDVGNLPVERQIENSIGVTLSGGMSGFYGGQGFGGYAGAERGSYAGNGVSAGRSFQSSNVYPDTWTGTSHPSGGPTGHIDLDSDTQGAVQNPFRPGVGGLGFDNVGVSAESGGYSGATAGSLGFYEAGGVDLSGSLSGNVVFLQTIYRETENNASLSGSALQGAVGNIGVNISAGSHNQQRNSIAIAAGLGRSGGGSGE